VQRFARPGLKVLFVSGYARSAIVRGEFLDAGMDMLTKPFALETLGAKVHAMLDKRTAEGS
jgi:DNA-binding response OmpR family regulator